MKLTPPLSCWLIGAMSTAVPLSSMSMSVLPSPLWTSTFALHYQSKTNQKSILLVLILFRSHFLIRSAKNTNLPSLCPAEVDCLVPCLMSWLLSRQILFCFLFFWFLVLITYCPFWLPLTCVFFFNQSYYVLWCQFLILCDWGSKWPLCLY